MVVMAAAALIGAVIVPVIHCGLDGRKLGRLGVGEGQRGVAELAIRRGRIQGEFELSVVAVEIAEGLIVGRQRVFSRHIMLLVQRGPWKRRHVILHIVRRLPQSWDGTDETTGVSAPHVRGTSDGWFRRKLYYWAIICVGCVLDRSDVIKEQERGKRKSKKKKRSQSSICDEWSWTARPRRSTINTTHIIKSR